MALIKCPDCGNSVSSSAPACPKCGCPIAGKVPNGMVKIKLGMFVSTQKATISAGGKVL